MTFKAEDLQRFQIVRREFFAYWPRLTIHGWAWLTDVKEISTMEQDGPYPWNFRRTRRHFEKLYHDGR